MSKTCARSRGGACRARCSIMRARLLRRADAARQPRRPRRHPAAPARAGRRLDRSRSRPRCSARAVAAGRDRADRHGRTVCARRRNAGRARRASRRHAALPLDHVDLHHRGRARGDLAAVLVPALHVPRPRLLQSDDRARQGGELLGAVRHRRPADARPAPHGHQERPHRAAAADHAQRVRPGDPARAGSWTCCARSAARSAMSISISSEPGQGAGRRARRAAGPTTTTTAR